MLPITNSMIGHNNSLLVTMMKISVITDVSVLRFYRYIGYIGDISADILEKKISISLKLIKIYKNIRKTS